MKMFILRKKIYSSYRALITDCERAKAVLLVLIIFVRCHWNQHSQFHQNEALSNGGIRFLVTKMSLVRSLQDKLAYWISILIDTCYPRVNSGDNFPGRADRFSWARWKETAKELWRNGAEIIVGVRRWRWSEWIKKWSIQQSTLTWSDATIKYKITYTGLAVKYKIITISSQPSVVD